ncbi:hypothetical protein BKG02_004767 [Vibrio parahaemolyticus]|uniref:hypothetical protein n=1 Tax=Vibrio parahaemolyticus TaxID=670 RepID=UPI002807AC4F|nr:hypothetical protein [Vibrio parahaemolyticus]EJE4644414.1 hypothetical protein [Vibrio parahaemolyticus]ELA9292961.1 hypothetical protein [Vibrio parahaemolyticus]HCG8016764.1 hypothetical protein [Vibrio parahaemolyticus]
MDVMKIFNLLVRHLIAIPGAGLLTVVFASMLLTKSGPVQTTESILQEVAGLVALGPAKEGFINLEKCADVKAETITTLDEPPVIEPVAICENTEVMPVAISVLAQRIGEAFIWSYLILVALGFGVSMVFSGCRLPFKPAAD